MELRRPARLGTMRPPGGRVSGSSSWDETLEQAEDSLEGLHFPSGLGVPWCPSKQLEEVTYKGATWVAWPENQKRLMRNNLKGRNSEGQRAYRRVKAKSCCVVSKTVSSSSSPLHYDHRLRVITHVT